MNASSQPLLSGAVVVGIDGSKHSNRALSYGIETALAEHRPLHLIHAHDPYPAALGTVVTLPEVVAGWEGNAVGVLQTAHTFVADAHPQVTVSSALNLGDPRAVLVDASREAHLLILGSRGMGPLRALLLGSVSAHVSQHAECPVVVVHPRGEQPDERVLVGVDGSEASTAAIDFAFRQAELHGLSLLAAHIIPSTAYVGYGVWAGVEDPPVDLAQRRLDVAESLAGYGEKYPDVPVEVRLKRDEPAPALAEMSATASLLVVGSHRRKPLQRILRGSVSRILAENAQCPVAVVPLH